MSLGSQGLSVFLSVPHGAGPVPVSGPAVCRPSISRERFWLMEKRLADTPFRMFREGNWANIRYVRLEEYKGHEPQFCLACLEFRGVRVVPAYVCVDGSGSVVPLCIEHLNR
jgi:hypothetical protein